MIKTKALIPILLISILFSCSPEKRLSRAKKKLANLVLEYPELVSRDTIFKNDTTVINEVWRDTLFANKITRDTLIIREKHLEIKYYNDGKNVYLRGKCDTIRVIKEVPFIVNTVSPIKEVHVIKWWDYAAYVISILALIFIAFDIWASKRK